MNKTLKESDCGTLAPDPKNPLVSKINLLAAMAIFLPYVNSWLSTTTGMPVLIEPDMAYNVILGGIIVIRTLWTQASTTLTGKLS